MSATLPEVEVLVTLSCILPPPDLTYPRRVLVLSNKKNTARIGRASKRTSGLEPRMYNGYINSPVISREHAELKFDSQSKTVFVRDIGSLHGTFHNGTKLQKNQFQALQDGDFLKFGIRIDRGDYIFPQCETKVSLKFRQSGEHGEAEPSLSQTMVFQVPDESDSEGTDDVEVANTDEMNSINNDDDEDDPVLRSGAAILAGNGLELEFRGFDASDAIDLTSEPDLVSEGNLLSRSSVSEDTDLPVHNVSISEDTDLPAHYASISEDMDLPVHDADHTLGRIPREEVEFKTVNALLNPRQRTVGFPRTAHDIFSSDGDVPGFYGPLSEDQHLNATSEILPGTFDHESWHDIITRGAEKKIYKDHVQTTFPPDNLLAQITSSPDDHYAEDKVHTQSDRQEDPVPRDDASRKRKAEQISGSSPVEVGEAERSSAVQSQDSQPRDVASNVDTMPPYKRIRTAAEYVGLMAIGGMAVMTALIATAPNF